VTSGPQTNPDWWPKRLSQPKLKRYCWKRPSQSGERSPQRWQTSTGKLGAYTRNCGSNQIAVRAGTRLSILLITLPNAQSIGPGSDFYPVTNAEKHISLPLADVRVVGIDVRPEKSPERDLVQLGYFAQIVDDRMDVVPTFRCQDEQSA